MKKLNHILSGILKLIGNIVVIIKSFKSKLKNFFKSLYIVYVCIYGIYVINMYNKYSIHIFILKIILQIIFLFLNIIDNVSIHLADRNIPETNSPDSSQPDNSQSDTNNNSQGNYGLYQEPQYYPENENETQYPESNTVASNDALFYAANLAEKVSQVSDILEDTNVQVQLSRENTVTSIGPNDLVGRTDTDLIVIKDAASIPQGDQKFVLDSVKEALHNLDKGKAKLAEAEIDFQDGVYGGYGTTDSEPDNDPNAESPRIVIRIEEDIADAHEVLEIYGNRLLRGNNDRNNNDDN
jgi:hypothetical protein